MTVEKQRVVTEMDWPPSYKIRYVERDAIDAVHAIKSVVYSPPLIPDIEGALKLAFECIARGQKVLDIHGPDNFKMVGRAVHEEYSARSR